MFCNACGKELQPNDARCRSCGAPVVPAVNIAATTPTGSKPTPSSPAPDRTPAAPAPSRPKKGGKVQTFWNRVSEGQAVSALWSELRTDARSTYRFYRRDIDEDRLEGTTQVRRFFRFAGQLFWAIVMKLSPARRVVLLIGIVLLFWPSGHVNTGTAEITFGSTATYGGLLILLVLVLEMADRVTMKRDLEIAREIQSWLVPTTPPETPKVDVAFTTRPANTVAGDYYDVFSRASGRMLIVVADVAGKSIPAALLMATFQASLRTLAESGSPLLELTQGLNRFLSAHSRSGLRFTTAFLGEFDPATGALTYVNAGHNAPIVSHATAVERLDVGGVPLGIRPDAAYECGTATLAAGDLLVLFTDGIVEAVNEQQQEYGETRLLNCIEAASNSTSAEVLRRLMQDVEAFVGTAPQHDDMTCVVVRCR